MAFLWLFCLDGCVMCERLGGPLAGLIWIMAQGQAALIHRQGKSSRSESPAADRHAPLFLLSRLALKSHNSPAGFGLSNVICSVYCLCRGVPVCTDLSVRTHGAAVFVHHLAGVRQLSDRWYTLKFQEYTDSCSSVWCNYLTPCYWCRWLMCSYFLCLSFRSPTSAHPTSSSA